MEMTDYQIRIEMAKCCGWKVERTHPESAYAQWSLINPEGKIVVDCVDEADGWNQFNLYPYYPADLNAMHEAEKILPDETRYLELLKWVCDHDWQHSVIPMKRNPIFATARQRSEAFLRALSKWKD